MITVGIIDMDEQERAETKKIISEINRVESTIPIRVLFDKDKLSTMSYKEVPDVVVVDIDRQDNLILERVKGIFPAAEILVLTNNFDVRIVRSCFRYGAVGYILKETCWQLLREAI
ncbi:hypothetical protein, partial [Sphingobacterium sp.]|uniref:hypothetical protein n=1 Tax=Sphingobacterium sp. TaxID=341027 RepID=UPI00289DDAC0